MLEDIVKAPANEPIIINPSSPIFITPLRSQYNAPSAVISRGIVYVIAYGKICTIVSHILFLLLIFI